MASISPLGPLPPPLSRLHRHPINSAFLPQFRLRKNPRPTSFIKQFPISATATNPSSSSSSSSWEREELRWAREEQRWLREERRWLREESRWQAEREALIREIASLRLKIDALERGTAVPAAEPAPVARIPEMGARPVLVEEAEVKEMILEEVRVSDGIAERRYEEVLKEEKLERRTLRKGSEGDDVRAMQEALSNMGFYSGEEDMEYSSFSSGTERAVKTWQASLGRLEDGVMTSELLETLFTGRSTYENTIQGGNSVSAVGKVGRNGAPTAVSEITEIKQTVIKESSEAEFEVSEHRVFLLGENRWEEPSRLTGRNKPITGSKAVVPPTKCLTCRGEGRLMCTECDGTGEPNIEPQFMEWVGEGTKCPYCEGLGYTVCDVCRGSAVTADV